MRISQKVCCNFFQEFYHNFTCILKLHSKSTIQRNYFLSLSLSLRFRGTNFLMSSRRKFRPIPDNHSWVAAFTLSSKWYRRFESSSFMGPNTWKSHSETSIWKHAFIHVGINFKICAS